MILIGIILINIKYYILPQSDHIIVITVDLNYYYLPLFPNVLR